MKTNTNISILKLAHSIKKSTGCTLSEAFKAAYSSNPAAAFTPKTSWTKDELYQIFSDKTAALLKKGYIIDLDHMEGSQGEIGKVFFKKGSDYFALIMESSYTCIDRYDRRYIIRFGKYTDQVYSNTTLWLDKFDTTWSMTVIQISPNFYVTEELAKQFNNKAKERWHNSPSKGKFEVVSADYYKVILACVRKQKGYKSTKLTDIVKVTRVVTYNTFSSIPNRRYYQVELNKLNKYGKNTTLDIRFGY